MYILSASGLHLRAHSREHARKACTGPCCAADLCIEACWCRAMPEGLATSTSLEEVDVGYNNLTAMPQLWISGDALQSPLAFVGMDNNDLTVSVMLL